MYYSSLDLIINTVSAPHQASFYMRLLDKKGTMVMLGVIKEPHQARNKERKKNFFIRMLVIYGKLLSHRQLSRAPSSLSLFSSLERRSQST